MSCCCPSLDLSVGMNQSVDLILVNNISLQKLLSHLADEGSVQAKLVPSKEAVCHFHIADGITPITYRYKTLFEHLGNRVPFSPFDYLVLRILKLAPTQLH